MLYITFAQDDFDFAREMANRLDAASLPVWYDENRLRDGTQWSGGLQKQLTTAAAVIVILSPASTVSASATFEWAFACGSRRPIIPVLYRKTAVHPIMRGMQGYDFSDPMRRPWERFIEHMSALVDRTLTQEMAAVLPDATPEAAPLESEPAQAALPEPVAVNGGSAPHPFDDPDLRAAIAEVEKGSTRALKNWLESEPGRLGVLFEIASETVLLDDFLMKRGVFETTLNSNRTLRDGDIDARIGAINTLANLIDDHNTVFPLVRATQDSVNDVAKTAIRALGTGRYSGAIPALVKLLDGERPDLMTAASMALARYGSAAIQPLTDALARASDPAHKNALLRALVGLKTPDVIRPLILQLEDNHEPYSVMVARALKDLAPASVEEMLRTTRISNDQTLRRAIFRALGRILDPNAIPPMIEALTGSDTDTGEVIITALMNYGQTAMPYLKEAVTHPDYRVRQAAASILQSTGLDPRQFGYRG